MSASAREEVPEGIPAPAWTVPDPRGQVLGFMPHRDPEQWRSQMRAALRDVMGLEPDLVPLDLEVEYDRVVDGVRDIRFHITTEPGERMAAHLLRPADATGDLPVMVCLQGHTHGMHVSLGIAHDEEDREDFTKDRDYARQVVAKGWAALAFDQRGFGERADARPAELRHGLEWRPCHQLVSVALLKGRTLLGERVWDVSRAIDALEHFDGIDRNRIGCIGDSTGGTVTYFAAAVDERITAVVPAAYVCSFRYSIMRHDHCEDHYLPGFLRYFELGDIAGLIAPRPLLIVTGAQDQSFPLAGAQEAYDRIEEIYRWMGAPDGCRFIVGPEGHRYYADLAWPVFEDITGWKGTQE